MRIFDCFTFCKELDLLEVRLKETYEHVDQFVIVESDLTFTGKPKPLYLRDNWKRFAPWHDKITLIHAQDLVVGDDPWKNEARSRENILQGIQSADQADLILVSDVDEIFRASTMKLMREHNKPHYGFRLPYFSFKLNYLRLDPTVWWPGGSASRKQFVSSIEQLRNQREHIAHDIGGVIRHAGWHFNNIGTDADIREKLSSFSHTEVCVPEILDRINVDTLIANNQGVLPDSKYCTVAFDHYFPASMVNNLEVWGKYVIDKPGVHARDFLNEHSVTARIQQ